MLVCFWSLSEHKFSTDFGVPSNRMGLKMLVWHKFSTDIVLSSNAMVFEKLVWHKLSTDIGLSLNRMVLAYTNLPPKSRPWLKSMESKY